MRLVLLHIQCPNYKLEKRGQGAHDIHVTHYYFKKGAFSQQQIKHLRVIHITPYSILNVLSGVHVHVDGNIKDSYWRLCYY